MGFQPDLLSTYALIISMRSRERNTFLVIIYTKYSPVFCLMRHIAHGGKNVLFIFTISSLYSVLENAYYNRINLPTCAPYAIL